VNKNESHLSRRKKLTINLAEIIGKEGAKSIIPGSGLVIDI